MGQKNIMKLLYGIQPTGRIHLGNYLGGLKKAIEEGAEILIANHHARTTLSPEEIDKYEEAMYDQLIHLGVKEENILGQSEENLELAWMIQCVTPMGDMERMTQYKDKKQGATVGLFTYPCLMAADIILSGAEGIIVGKDQEQHMEFYRRTCKRLGVKNVASVIFTDTPKIMSVRDVEKKMSKSLGDEHCLYLGDHDQNERKVMLMPTDKPGMKNIVAIAKGLGVAVVPRNMRITKEKIINALEELWEK